MFPYYSSVHQSYSAIILAMLLLGAVLRIMKGIVEALKSNEDLRITNFKKWMVYNQFTKEWEVYEEKNGEGVMIENTRDEVLAVNWLLSE